MGWIVGVEEKSGVGMDAEEWVEWWYRCQRAFELSDDERARSGGREVLNTQCLEVWALDRRVVLAAVTVELRVNNWSR